MNKNDYIGMGFSELYQLYAKEQTDAPLVYHQALSYLIASCMVSKNVYMPFGDKKLYPNLYLLIVGPSSLHRKSWAQGMATRMIDRVRPNYEIMECSSRESFIAEFSNSERLGCGLIEIDEFKGFMTRVKAKQHMDGFLQDLASAYDNRKIRRRKGVSKKETEVYEIDEPFLNITAACSFDWLTEAAETSDITGGFLARFLWIIYNEEILHPKSEPSPYDPEKHEILLSKMNFMTQMIGEAAWSISAKKYWEKFYDEFMSNHQGGIWDAHYNRLTIIIKKISLLNAVMRLEKQGIMPTTNFLIEEQDLRHAILFCEGTVEALDDIVIGNSEKDVKTKKVFRFIQKKDGCKHEEVLRGIRDLSAWELKNIIQTLTESGQIKIENYQNFTGRPGIKYRVEETVEASTN